LELQKLAPNMQQIQLATAYLKAKFILSSFGSLHCNVNGKSPYDGPKYRK